MLPLATIRRLHDRGPGCRGLAVDPEGVVLGPDCVLVRPTPRGYRCAAPDEIALLRRAVFDDDTRLGRLPIVLASIVRALDRGDLVMAQLLGLEIPLDSLDDDRLWRLSRAADLIKAGFDPDQPRDDHGRWTSEAALHAITAGLGAATSLLGDLAPETLSALRAIAARINTATAVFQILFIPTNQSLISAGTLPDHPDITYHYDRGTGVLSLEREGAPVFSSRADHDGLFRDSDGRPIGRKIDGNLILDGDALPGAKPGSPENKPEDKPKLCPDPDDDRKGEKKAKDIAYQKQITGLKEGLAVRLPSRSDDPRRDPYVYFDGCRESDGTMLEAKSTGFLAMMQKSPSFWEGKIMAGFYKQADHQVTAAASRLIEWHFAEKEVADYVRAKFAEKDFRITVIYTPPLSGSQQ